jgi:hypothetical protein
MNMTIRRIGSIGGVSYIDPDTYTGALPINLVAELDDDADVQGVIAAITAAGGTVQTIDDIYGRNVVFFSISDIEHLNVIQDITGVYLVKEPYTTYPWSYVEEEEQGAVTVVDVPVVEDEDDGVAAFVRNNIKPILVISVTAVVLYFMYGKGSRLA